MANIDKIIYEKEFCSEDIHEFDIMDINDGCATRDAYGFAYGKYIISVRYIESDEDVPDEE